ncbi:MAG TPA: hypothetical protein H9722_01210 [Candidatus Mediterraneibacter pullistercoris]|nr:hypothetical protein [Candidatus Mediterraneibacter pullistercoris]
MQELEKILEEIEQAKREPWYRLSNYDVKHKLDGAINRIVDIIRKHMNDSWIPVEKDLPKNESEVWVILESTYGTGYRTYSSARYLYFENYGESHWCDNHYGYLEWDKYSDGHGGSSQYKVIAWQPIKPYRPERSIGE